MVQFKDVFLGREKRDYVRAATAQKCVRAGGKHNDLENVGRTARHNTFFEMLGNFSFGDYFKEKAITLAWEFLTEQLHLPKDKLWVTVYKDDDEAFNLWHERIGIPTARIGRMGEKDNFWAMGDTGPCGPCSEIIIDQGPGVGCGRPECGLGCDCDRYIELWNLVFMQFNRDATGTMTPLPKPSIDTGMGLERITTIIQGVGSIFDTDLLRPIIAFVEEHSGKVYGQEEATDVSLRVIADHSRAMTFLIHDGVLPANEGRGYVLRRILRRAARHGKLLGIPELFLFQTAHVVVQLMEQAYPELRTSQEYVAKVIRHEEERFAHTLDQGLRVFQEVIEQIKAKKKQQIPGAEIFKLYDTFGFPLDLMEEIAHDQGLKLDHGEFEDAMTKQRERARAAWVGSGEAAVKPLYREIRQTYGPTTFVGYQTLASMSQVLVIIRGDALASEAHPGETVEILLDQTPFYGESGGQVGDQGVLSAGDLLIEILDTQKPLTDLSVHTGKVRQGVLRTGTQVRARVDTERRQATVLNHSATHLLHAALRAVLGDHVKQSGSLVAPDRLRFDFTHFARVSPQERDRIEELVNAHIRQNVLVQISHMTLDEALKKGAMALFGEKYGEKVRVVQMGDISLELCGGTHATATGDIGIFKIVQEGGVAAGVRRIEALTGERAYRYVKKEEETLTAIRELLKAQPFEEASKLQRLYEHTHELEREVTVLKEKLLRLRTSTLLDAVVVVQGIKVLTTREDNLNRKALRAFVDSTRDRLQSGVVVVGSVTDSKVALVAGITKDLTAKLSADILIKKLSALVDGGGGGRADLAEAGGKSLEKLDSALQAVPQIVESLLEAQTTT
jgi:alanyl-tRNA synthetase